MGADLDDLQDPLGLHRVGYAEPLLAHRALRVRDGTAAEGTEQVAEEVPVALVYNGAPHVVMMATPADLEDFVLGFSLTEGLIGGPADLWGIEVVRYGQGIEVQVSVTEACMAGITQRQRRLTGRTGCGICGSDSVAAVLGTVHQVSPGPQVTPAALLGAIEGLAGRQQLNAAAGAVHAAGFATAAGSIMRIREDVGRHNALDKLIGALSREGIDPGSGFIVVTSRASFEMVQKSTVFGTGLLAAISGPTGLAIRVAEQAGLTLVGFVRGSRYTIYTHPERVELGE